MSRIIFLTLVVALAGCASAPTPRETSGCIRGDPSGPLHCQAETYRYAS